MTMIMPSIRRQRKHSKHFFQLAEWLNIVDDQINEIIKTN